MRRAIATLLLAWLGLAPPPALAHKPSDSYLTISVADGAVSGRWDIALRDLDFALGLDADGDGAITWGEVRARHGEIAAYALARLAIRSGGADAPRCSVEAGALADAAAIGAAPAAAMTGACACTGPGKAAAKATPANAAPTHPSAAAA